ncbi:MAG: hypothetical protein AMQ22_00275 [Candidatus Methanofastidiosum methylothiophilum]|uniref:Isoprenylcysteine carboxyl methyltransferase (ICMT) family protein n=1 Tax=Candidatus Methanofastidiosum methylothiophilum TaxID=1705564 RepID=A0A150J829_9EURY|nr:MAG: hypothetical protein AMQ22_00275 [Candidatus Methanofastidiosum methylthiophilus]
MNELFQIGITLCFLGYLVHTRAHIKGYKSGDYKNIKMEIMLSIVIFFSYFGWGLMLFNDPLKIFLDQSILGLILGIALALIGLSLFVMAANTCKGFIGPNCLVTEGIYSKIRNPMYIGIILIHIGGPLIFNSLITLISNVLWIPLIVLWIYLEEKDLEKQFGQKYLDYKKKTLL